MLGFVSALSSALAVIILIMSIMLVNLLKSATNNSSEQSELEVNPENVARIQNMATSLDGFKLDYNIVTSDVLEAIKTKPDLKTINLSCTYGNNFNLAIAEKYITFNLVILKKTNPDLEINYEKPSLDEKGLNYCRVNF